jgi:ATP-dependent Clp protease ATP-binding subunit ClpC
MYRGEFEARLRQIIDEAKANPNLILFIDEVHTMVGAGAASGSMDAANMLKPALARGEIRCIGATTPEEFKKTIENDRALERRFQTVRVEEPTDDKTQQILEGVTPHYEQFHGVRFAPDAIESAVHFAGRYIQDKHFPDKALDLLDEAAAATRVNKAESTTTEQKRKLEQRLDTLRKDKRAAVIEERFLDAVSFKEEEAKIKTALLASSHEQEEEPLQLITERDIARVVSRMTGIPLADILLEEQAALKYLEKELSLQVLGQDDALRAVSDALRRAKTGMAEPNRPLASFLFLGPSGVGKTELAKSIAKNVFHDPKALIRLDMSEFAEGFTVSKLIGAPAGYVGYREKARLTDSVKQRPYSVVLFDELEKAHKDVQNLLLQLLEEGEVTDSTSRNVSFRNTIVIMTSNVGLEKFNTGGMGFHSGKTERVLALSQDLRTELEERFRPELINRIDHTLTFQPLDEQTLTQIAEKQLEELRARVALRGTELDIQDDIAAFLATQVNELYGARDLKRHIQQQIESKIAGRFLKGKPPKALSINLKNGTIRIKRS